VVIVIAETELDHCIALLRDKGDIGSAVDICLAAGGIGSHRTMRQLSSHSACKIDP
jgi:hypothetical protein